MSEIDRKCLYLGKGKYSCENYQSIRIHFPLNDEIFQTGNQNEWIKKGTYNYEPSSYLLTPLSNIQQICSRQHWTFLGKYMENPLQWESNFGKADALICIYMLQGWKYSEYMHIFHWAWVKNFLVIPYPFPRQPMHFICSRQLLKFLWQNLKRLLMVSNIAICHNYFERL